ncbi:FAD/NAD(P)-binding domain-containing protein [Dendrothele bispora CBS 962.96]|uniref:FAD/NAD(P)-binding domain-containing protein n=1 Tax=Dendrothele bispora (strain CBS 962.96) TaxID=1314807 RepID=A0A4V4HII4_DENBC|nr:FAD/NAD(P)-binding domain-containing protein [Dendrothele bispora CBS 962.96]
MSSQTKVIIVGAGIAGPVLGMFLKSKGYHVVIYERIKRDSDGGLSLMVQQNGLRVLSLIPGIVDKLPGKQLKRMSFLSTVPGDEGVISEVDKEGGIGVGVRRHEFLALLQQSALDKGVEIHWEHKVVDVQTQPDSALVTLESGQTDTASFVVGCDGLHSNTRICLFGEEKAAFTGLTQIGGFTTLKEPLTEVPAIVNFFGDGAHMITYPVGNDKYSWAISRQEYETKEAWRTVDDSMMNNIRNDACSQWGFGASTLIKNTEKVVKYGLYDRPELKTWYKGRVVLLGDAAHPTSPHLGQGANQAFEDIYCLIRSMVKHNPEALALSTEALTAIFQEYEHDRIARSAAMVKGARKMGESRVVVGHEASIARNNALRPHVTSGTQWLNFVVAAWLGGI